MTDMTALKVEYGDMICDVELETYEGPMKRRGAKEPRARKGAHGEKEVIPGEKQRPRG